MFFFRIAQEEIVFGNLKKDPGKLHYQVLITLVITQ